MKVRFIKNVTVDVEDRHEDGNYSKAFNRWDEIKVEEIFPSGKYATLQTYDEKFFINVPADSFETLQDTKRDISTLL